MKKFLTMLSLVLLGFASTSCYDDSELWESVEDLDARVETLETLCTQMNSNLTALTELINAMTMGDVIIGVTPVKENGVEVGWQILLKDGGVVTIYHGKDGADGADGKDGADGTNGTNGANGQDAVAPEFGFAQDTDGIYYWTLNGEFVVDAEGNKVPVTGPAGTDGTNGVTPQLKIENNTWYVTYNGETWEEVGAAVAVGITNVETVGGNLVISMADGKEISVPLGSSLEVVLGEFDATALQYGSDLEIPYTIEGAEGEVVVFLLREGEGFAVELVEETATSGKVTVSQLEATATEKKLKVGIFASGEDGTTVSKSVRLVSGVFATVEGNQETYAVEPAGGKVEFKVATNTAFEVKIEDGCDWITYVPQTKAVEEVALSFEVAANQGEEAREATVEVVSGDITLSFTVTQEGGFTFEETLVGAYKIKKIWVYGGTGPQYGGAGWYPIFEKTWFFDQTTGHGIGAELDNYFEFTLTEYNNATKQSTGQCVNWAGKDGKNWDCWFHDNKNNAGEYRIADGAKDVNNFYRQIPIGTSTWVRDYNVTPNTVTFTDADGKQTVLKLYEASSPFEFVPGYNDKNATANTRYFPGTYKAGESPAAGMDMTFHATVKGTDFWGGEDKQYTSVESELDKMYYNPREVIFDVQKFDSVPEESKKTEGKVTPVIPERPQPEIPALPTTLAGTYKYSTDFTVGGKDGSITVKGLTDQYATWEPAASKVKLIKNDLYTFTPNGTDANGNETGTVTFDDGGDGTWDFSIYDNTNNNKIYDATELYCFIAQDNTSTYVYDATAGTITFTTRGEELVVDYLVPGTYKYSTQDVTVPTSSTFGMHYDMGYTEARIPGYSTTSNGCARHYVWARDWVLCLVKQ